MDNPLVQVNPGLYVWTILVFIALLVALRLLAWKPLLAALKARQDAIAKSLDDAKQARQELERLHAESARILAEARTQAESIIAATRADASRFRDELKQKAQAEAAGIVRNAEKQIELETARAVQQIRHEAVELSVAIASKLLQRHVSRADNERLIEDTFRQLEATQQRPS
jgi:F-type H+-transporting ATPase subunit b